jgi:hypothetical protein
MAAWQSQTVNYTQAAEFTGWQIVTAIDKPDRLMALSDLG